MMPNETPPQTEPRGPIDLLIVIVNYKTAGLTIDCLRLGRAGRSAGFRDGRARVVVTDSSIARRLGRSAPGRGPR